MIINRNDVVARGCESRNAATERARGADKSSIADENLMKKIPVTLLSISISVRIAARNSTAAISAR